MVQSTLRPWRWSVTSVTTLTWGRWTDTWLTASPTTSKHTLNSQGEGVTGLIQGREGTARMERAAGLVVIG